MCDFCGEANPLGVDFCECGALPAQMHRRRVFSLSLGDWLDDEVPIEWLADMLDVIRQCPNLDWLLCTKRPELWRTRLGAVAQMVDAIKIKGDALENWVNAWIEGEPPPNVMLLASVEDQAAADKRIPALLKIPARWRGLSCEPLLGPVDIGSAVRLGGFYKSSNAGREADDATLDWVIIGGESGPNARRCNVAWVTSLKEQAQAAGVPVFVKQLGAVCVDNTGYDTGITDKKGGDWSEWPEDLRVREFYR